MQHVFSAYSDSIQFPTSLSIFSIHCYIKHYVFSRLNMTHETVFTDLKLLLALIQNGECHFVVRVILFLCSLTTAHADWFNTVLFLGDVYHSDDSNAFPSYSVFFYAFPLLTKYLTNAQVQKQQHASYPQPGWERNQRVPVPRPGRSPEGRRILLSHWCNPHRPRWLKKKKINSLFVKQVIEGEEHLTVSETQWIYFTNVW